jgi:hypothetical protein
MGRTAYRRSRPTGEHSGMRLVTLGMKAVALTGGVAFGLVLLAAYLLA